MQFAAELKKLNKAQRLAVETIEGPVMVVAGPGTGKTATLALRIANIRVQTDTPAESILALTFTDAASGEMRQRLVEIMGQDGYKVAVRTFHSFCNELITDHPESFPHIAGGASVAEVDQIRIVRDLIDASKLELLRSFGKPYNQVRDIIKAISELKREGVSPDEFSKVIKAEEAAFDEIPDLYNEKGAYKGKMKGKYVTQQRRNEKLKELLVLYRGYQKALLKTQRYDYDDMLIEAAAALKKDKALLQSVHEKYLYVLVDEHQDTNSSQNAVLELLVSYDDSPNLFMVGDEKQAIYRFQGASLENFEYFKRRLRHAKIIHLEENYRSTQTIIDAATDIALGKGGLQAKSGHKETPISLLEFAGVDEEVFGVAMDIKNYLDERNAPDPVRGRARTKGASQDDRGAATSNGADQIAVLYRENKESQAVAGMLSRLGIPYAISADDDVLTDGQIQKLLRILLAVRHFGQASYLCEALLVDSFGLDPLDVYRFTTYCRDNRLDHYTVIRSLAALNKIGLLDADKLHRVYLGLSGWKSLADNESAAKVFEFIVRESNYLAHLLSRKDSADSLAKLNTLFDMVKEFMLRRRNETLHDFIDELELLREHEVRVKPVSVTTAGDRVHLMTAHKSKGLQFERVYIMGAVDGKWGNRRSHDKIKLPESIYRLEKEGGTFLRKSGAKKKGNVINEGGVGGGMTRHTTDEGDESDERNLFYVALTRAKKHVIISYSTHARDGKDLLPSQFIGQIRPGLIKKQTVKNAAAHQELVLPAEALAQAGADVKTKEFIVERFKKSGITPTALNNYLECPLKYFYLNIVHIPEAPNKFSQFGNAAHAALRFAVESAPVNKAQFLARFKAALRREPMSEAEEADFLKKGEQSLGAYFDLMRRSLGGGDNVKHLCEYAIEGVQLSKDVMVRGRIDRVDVNEDGSAHVVDYKTGKPKSRNQIAGKTKDSDGGYYRQLVFYKLLLEREGKYKVKDAELDFVEGPKREIFAPSDKEVKELEAETKRVAAEILTGEFNGCKEKECRYCGLKN